jgi:Tfp pilus assembly protein PilW
LIKETFGSLQQDRTALDLLTSSARQAGDFRFLPAEYNRSSELEMLLTNVRLLNSNWSSSFLFWDVQHPKAQLDIRVRRFAINRREMNRYREALSAKVKEMRMREIELTMS